MLIIYFLFPPLERRFNSHLIFNISLLVQVPVLFLSGFIQLTASNSIILWILVVIYGIYIGTFQAFCFSTVCIMISNSATKETRGIVNGASQSAASFLRTFGPSVAGYFWSFSIGPENQYPFNFHFCFVLLSLINFLSYLQALSIPKRLAKPIE